MAGIDIYLTKAENNLRMSAMRSRPQYTSCGNIDQLLLPALRSIIYAHQHSGASNGSQTIIDCAKGLLAKYLYAGVKESFISLPSDQLARYRSPNALFEKMRAYYARRFGSFGAWRANVELEMLIYSMSSVNGLVHINKADLERMLRIVANADGSSESSCEYCLLPISGSSIHCGLCGYANSTKKLKREARIETMPKL